MAQTNLNIRMDDELKQEFDLLCNELGLTMTTAINVFARAFVRKQGMPFEVSKNIPNASTLAAIEEVQTMKLNPHLNQKFDSVQALFEDLNDDD